MREKYDSVDNMISGANTPRDYDDYAYALPCCRILAPHFLFHASRLLTRRAA